MSRSLGDGLRLSTSRSRLPGRGPWSGLTTACSCESTWVGRYRRGAVAAGLSAADERAKRVSRRHHALPSWPARAIASVVSLAAPIQSSSPMKRDAGYSRIAGW